ncbi:MAG: ribosome silencing factor [Bacteroidales bacterium]|jgi:ribosome-associated protein|nr:ribosome silencing factor [Bacteroidales bacterium]
MIKQNSSMDLATVVTEAMFDKKASKIIVMDMRAIAGASFDVFVICEAVSAIQVRAIADGVEEMVFKQLHEHPLHSEGFINAEWILLDYGNVVVHVFQERVRAHIRLEELWFDAKTTVPKEKKSAVATVKVAKVAKVAKKSAVSVATAKTAKITKAVVTKKQQKLQKL